MTEKKYCLASGTQVREEDFGLLFYTMKGPRLYFLPTRNIIDPSFFTGKVTLEKALTKTDTLNNSHQGLSKIEKCLEQLIDKGVILEC